MFALERETDHGAWITRQRFTSAVDAAREFAYLTGYPGATDAFTYDLYNGATLEGVSAATGLRWRVLRVMLDAPVRGGAA